MKTYKRRLSEIELSVKYLPDSEKFDVIPNRLFYYLAPYKGKTVWQRTSQGNYNWMRFNGYTVSYVDNAIIDDTEF